GTSNSCFLCRIIYCVLFFFYFFFFFSSRRRHTRFKCDWSSDVCSSDLRSAPSAPSGRQEYPLSVAFGKSANNCSRRTKVRPTARSEERRVGKECRSRWSRDH